MPGFGLADALGLPPGESDGRGEKAPPPATTFSGASLWHVLSQQIVTTWSPSSVSVGTTMSRDTWPFESAVKGKVWTTLCSWISPTWCAGTWLAVTWTVPPGPIRSGLTASVVAWATTAQTPISRSRTSSAARPIATRLRERLGAALVSATVAAGGGKAIATVAAAARAFSFGRASTAVGGVVATGSGSAGSITMVASATEGHCAWPFAIAAASASTNAVALSQRSAGFLARPRKITLSTSGLSVECRELGAGASRWTWAYSTSIRPSPSNGMTPVSIS